MTKPRKCLLPAIAGGSMEKNITASWRNLKPVHRELTSPCRDGCAAGVRPELFIHHMAKGEVKDAYHVILEAHPFPAIMGRVCYRECENQCSREHFDRAVAISTLERVTGDRAIDEGFGLGLPKGKNDSARAGVIGAGPAGLSFAYHMRKAGFAVTLYDMKGQPGGMIRHVIPEYRLPSRVVDAEIGRLVREGVTHVRKRFDRDDIVPVSREFDVFLIATGAWRSTHPFRSLDEKTGMVDAIRFLEMTRESPVSLRGKKTVIIGGGNSAIDSARAALRLGADVEVFYRRDEKDMPAYGEETREALREGIAFHFRHTPHSPLFAGDTLRGVRMTRTEVERKRGAGGRGKVIVLAGTEYDIPCHLLIFATGEDPAFTEREVEIGENLFIAGDALENSGRTVTAALGSGKSAAHRFLKSAGLMREDAEDGGDREVAGADLINRDYVRAENRIKVKALPIDRRILSFEEVVKTPSYNDAAGEAARCLSCGVCSGCGNCRIFCPDGAVRLVSGRYDIDYDYCKGCGICWTECPCGAMTWKEE